MWFLSYGTTLEIKFPKEGCHHGSIKCFDGRHVGPTQQLDPCGLAMTDTSGCWIYLILSHLFTEFCSESFLL